MSSVLGPDRALDHVLRVGSGTPVRTLDPREVQDSASALCVMQAFETPFAPPVDLDQPPAPLLFSGPLVEERGGDRPVLSGRVRHDARFWDGSPVTPADVAASLAGVEGVSNHAEVAAEGDRVVFALRRPHPRFALLLSNHFCSVVREGRNGLVGTGAFVVVPGGTPAEMRLVRNPHYRRPVHLEEIVFTSCGGSVADGLREGEIDFAVDLARQDLAALDGLTRWFQPGVSTCSLYFNTEAPELADVRVRRALALAVDREALARLSFQSSLGFTARGLLPSLMGGGFRDGIERDPAAAAALLRAAGVTLPLRLELLLPWAPRLYLPHPQLVADALAAQLAAVGVEIAFRASRDIVDFYERTCDPGYQLALIGWVPDSIDPSEFLEVTLASHAVPEIGKSQAVRSNFARWCDPAADALLERYRREGDDATRDAILGRVAGEVPLLPLVYGPSLPAHVPELVGLQPMPIAYHHRFADVDLERRARRLRRFAAG
jgi:ABC-type transport system substrate-binding protein